MESNALPKELLFLPLPRLEREEFQAAGQVTGADLDLDYQEVPRTSAFDITVHAYTLGREKIVQGRISGSLALSCSRCGVPFSLPFRLDYRHCYVPGTPKDLMDSPDDGNFFYPEAAAELDIRPGLREEILLQVPLRPIPEPGTPEHCQTCDLDDFEAKFEPQTETPADNRFSALAKLLEGKSPKAPPPKKD